MSTDIKMKFWNIRYVMPLSWLMFTAVKTLFFGTLCIIFVASEL